MAASSVTSSHLTVVVVLHLIFSVIAIAFLSYKVYFPDNDLSNRVYLLEKELSSIRQEISLEKQSDSLLAFPSPTPMSTVQPQYYRRERNRRAIRRNTKSSKDQLQAECVKNLLNNLKVSDILVNGTGKLVCMRGPQGPPGPPGRPGPPGPHGNPGKNANVMFSPPRFATKLPSLVSLRKGGNLLLDISVSGNPAPKVTCSVRGRHRVDKSRYTITDDKLEMRGVRFEDQGMITCRAENLFGIEEKRVELVVLGSPRFLTSPPGQLIGYLGKETKLQCDALGNPSPEVRWTRSPPAPFPEGRTVLRKNGLYINNTEIGDGGTYFCTATNKYGKIIHGTFLKVKPVEPPVFTSKPATLITVPGIGDSIRVSCSAKGSPLPQITWYKNKVIMNTTNNTSTGEVISELEISQFKPTDQATYTCVARNEYNDKANARSRIVLPDCGDPGKPNNAVVISTNHWAGGYVRYLCHPGYTMIGPAVRRCLSSGKWSGNMPTCTDKPECVFHTSLQDYTRYDGHSSGGTGYKCDNRLTEGWYRFLTGQRMSERYYGSQGYCDTSHRGRLTGGHPSVSDGIVTRRVCFSGSSPSCNYARYIKVRKCGNFYVYKLKPTPYCNLRYCTAVSY